MSSINLRTKCPARSVVSISFAKSKNFCSKFLADAAAVAAQVGAVRAGGVTIGAPGGAPNVDVTAAHDGAPDVEADADPVEDWGSAGGNGTAAHAGAAEAGPVRGGFDGGGTAQVDAIDDDDVASGNHSGAAMYDSAGVASAGRLVGSPDI